MSGTATSHARMWCCFFFQAEDGIRDYKVTGVQTCALPICLAVRAERSDRAGVAGDARDPGPVGAEDHPPGEARPAVPRVVGLQAGRGQAGRSEERRGGEECRSRWAPYHLKKKKKRKVEKGR